MRFARVCLSAAMKKTFEAKISTMQHDVDAQLDDIKQVILQQVCNASCYAVWVGYVPSA